MTLFLATLMALLALLQPLIANLHSLLHVSGGNVAHGAIWCGLNNQESHECPVCTVANTTTPEPARNPDIIIPLPDDAAQLYSVIITPLQRLELSTSSRAPPV